MPDRLWVCHACNMIGEDRDAERHVELKGHRVVQLTQTLSDSIRAEWTETGDPRAEAPAETTQDLSTHVGSGICVKPLGHITPEERSRHA